MLFRSLWGAQAVSGVVNVVTRAPKPGSSARISAEYGGLNTRYASGVFNAGGPTGGVVLDGAYFGTGGTNIAHAGHENDGYRNITLGGRGEAKMRDVTLSAALHHVSARSETDSADFLGTLAIPTDTGDFTKAHMTYGRAQATADFASDAQGILGLSWTGTDSRNYASPSFPPKFSDVAFNDSSRGSKLKFDGQFNASWNRGSADQHASLLVEHAQIGRAHV